jgi:DNA-binding transcriptional ArsR family regulator
VHAFEVLADPVRRRLLELLSGGEVAAGELTAVVRAEFGITQPAVSQHLRVLREHGFAAVRPQGARRLYAVPTGAYDEVDQWLARYHGLWRRHLDALDSEIARGRHPGSDGG